QYISILNPPEIRLQVTTAPCELTNLSCDLQRYGAFSGLGLLLLLVALAVLWVALRPSPFGVFKTSEGILRTVGRNRSIVRRLLYKSTIFSDELQTIGCPGARFDLRFERGKQARLIVKKGSASLGIWPAQTQSEQSMRSAEVGKAVPLRNGERLVVEGQP